MKKAANKLAAILDGNRWSSISVSILSILLSLICASIILLVLGKNPLVAFQSFLQGAGFLPKANYGGGSGMLSDLFTFLNLLAPMILAALSFIVGFKAGLFNIGISGQMLTSGFLATAIVGYSGLDAVIAKPLVIVIGIVAGGLLGAFIGFLKYKFNIHEVVSTIMVNYIVNYLTGFFINTYFADPLTRSMRICSSEARLTWMDVPLGGVACDIPLGIVLAVLAALIVKFIFDKTVFGFELRAVGGMALEPAIEGNALPRVHLANGACDHVQLAAGVDLEHRVSGVAVLKDHMLHNAFHAQKFLAAICLHGTSAPFPFGSYSYYIAFAS